MPRWPRSTSAIASLFVPRLAGFTFGGLQHHRDCRAGADRALGGAPSIILPGGRESDGPLVGARNDKGGSREALRGDRLATFVEDMNGERVAGCHELSDHTGDVLHRAAVGTFRTVTMLRKSR